MASNARVRLTGRAEVWLLGLGFLVVGCGGSSVPPSPTGSTLTPAQETATNEYVAVLERQIEVVEETAAVLATVNADAASKEAAKTRLLKLSLDSEAANRQVKEKQPGEVAVYQAAHGRVETRQLQAAAKLQAEIRRINAMTGGPDFFEKELRPLLAALKGQ
jgi:hypothetical protein